jgi:NADH-quinone oxidoreductase subunit J
MIQTILLWLFTGTALACGAAMLVLRHPMRVALALVTSMLALAGVYATLGAHAVAVFQILIYVGAVMVFMIYVIMLIDARDTTLVRRFSWLLAPAIALALILVAAIATNVGPELPLYKPQQEYGVSLFSVDFLNQYWVHFELVSVLLIAGVVAALAVIQVGRRHDG